MVNLPWLTKVDVIMFCVSVIALAIYGIAWLIYKILNKKKGMTEHELKELTSKSAQAHTEILKYCCEELKQSVIVKRRKKNRNKKTHR